MMMAAFTINEILEATGGDLIRPGAARSCSGVSTDTRSLREGDLFIPLAGENFDGHRFLAAAAAGGASAVLTSRRDAAEIVPEGTAVIFVGNTLTALEELARFHRLRFDIPVVAVTGSNGKTTTKDMVSAILKKKYRVCHTKKNFNNEIGLSHTLLSLTEEDQVCVTEMGMRGFGQIAELCRTALPSLGIVTNVGTSHIGILGSRENIAKAKSELIKALPKDGTAVLNEDDDFVRAMGDSFSGRVISYGVLRQKDVYAEQIKFRPEGTDFRCVIGEEAEDVHLKLFGIHNVYDALAAAAAGRFLGVPFSLIKETLEEFTPQGDSQKLRRIRGALVLDDSYNANPLSLEMAFRALLQLPGKRHILVVGDMLELGQYAEELHRSMGKKAAELGFDLMISVGGLGRLMAEEAAAGGMETVCLSSAEEAADYLKGHCGEGDAVLIKASHAMHLDKIADLWRGEKE